MRLSLFKFSVFIAIFLIFSSVSLASLNDLPEGNETLSENVSNKQVKPYVFSFTGNVHFTGKELLKAAAVELQMFEKKGYRKADIDDAAFQMQSLYRQAGYAFVSVEYRYDRADNKISVTFRIEEGPRVLVKQIIFDGNSQISTEILRDFFSPDISKGIKQQKVVFIESGINDAVNRIRDYYLGEGFIDVAVSNPNFVFSEDRSSVEITIKISEGPKYVIHEVLYKGETIPALSDKLEKIRKDLIGKSYYVRRKLLLRTKLQEVYDEVGFADAEFEIATVKDQEHGSIVMQADITSGEKVRISDIVINGNKSTKDSFIRNKVVFKPGDIYTNAKRRDSFRNLFDTGLFTKISIELAPSGEAGGRNLEINVEELPTREIYIEPGWGSYEEFRLRAGVFERSLFGTGRNGRIDGLVHTKGENVTLSYTDPWFLQTDIQMNVPVYYDRREEPSYTSEEKGLSLLFTRKMSKSLTLAAGYQYKLAQLFSLNEDLPLPEEEENYNKGTMNISAVWDTRDDIFYPANGLRLAAGFDISLPALGSDLQFGRITLGCRYFWELPRKYILGLRATTGLIIPLADQVSIPISERFFNGGDNTVRSYRHSRLGPKDDNNEPIGGNGYNVFSIELRKKFYKNFAATLYIDAGNVSPNDSLTELGFMKYTSRSDLLDDTLTDYFKEFKYGIGLGLQYLLPVGPIRFDIAYNPDPEEIWAEDTWVYHFSLGMAF